MYLHHSSILSSHSIHILSWIYMHLKQSQGVSKWKNQLGWKAHSHYRDHRVDYLRLRDIPGGSSLWRCKHTNAIFRPLWIEPVWWHFIHWHRADHADILVKDGLPTFLLPVPGLGYASETYAWMEAHALEFWNASPDLYRLAWCCPRGRGSCWARRA